MIANFENADMILDGKIWDLDPNAVLIKDHEIFSLQQIILQHEKEKIILTGDLLGKNPLQIKIIQLDLAN